MRAAATLGLLLTVSLGCMAGGPAPDAPTNPPIPEAPGPSRDELAAAWPGGTRSLQDALEATDAIATRWAALPAEAPPNGALLVDSHRLGLLRQSEQIGRESEVAAWAERHRDLLRPGVLGPILEGEPTLRQVPAGVEVMVMPSGGLWLTLPPGTISEPVASWVRETATVAVVNWNPEVNGPDYFEVDPDGRTTIALAASHLSNWELLVPPGSSRVQRE